MQSVSQIWTSQISQWWFNFRPLSTSQPIISEGNPTERFKDLGKLNFPVGGLNLGSSQFSILPQLPPKILLDSKVVKIDPKIIILLH